VRLDRRSPYGSRPSGRTRARDALLDQVAAKSSINQAPFGARDGLAQPPVVETFLACKAGKHLGRENPQSAPSHRF
jgi:hypothetical protein